MRTQQPIISFESLGMEQAACVLFLTFFISLQCKELVQTMNIHVAMASVSQKDGFVIVIMTVMIIAMNKDVVRCRNVLYTRHMRT